MGVMKQAHPPTKFKQPTRQTSSAIALVVLTVLLIAITNVALVPDGDAFDPGKFFNVTNLEVIGVEKIAYPLLLVALTTGVSIFSLVVRYKGGHSGRKYFNDRTIENNKLTFLRHLFNDDSQSSRHLFLMCPVPKAENDLTYQPERER